MKEIKIDLAHDKIIIGEESIDLKGPYEFALDQKKEGVGYIRYKRMEETDKPEKERNVELLSRLEEQMDSVGSFFREHDVKFKLPNIPGLPIEKIVSFKYNPAEYKLVVKDSE